MTAPSMRELAQRLRGHVVALAAEIGERHVRRPDALGAAARYIRERWAAQGHAVRAQRYVTQGVECENLEVVVDGPQAGRVVLLGAHYDTVPGSPGADDNASGVSALLEIGRMLAQARPVHSVRLVAFVNEEPPFFPWGDMGSRVYAREARGRGDDIRVMLSLEMLGCYSDVPGSQRYPPLLGWFYPDRGNFIAFVSNLASRRALREAARAFRAQCDFPCESLAAPSLVPGVAWSDQRSFWAEGYPALMVTDTAFNRYDQYHTQLDTPDRLCYPAMARVVHGLALTALALAGNAGEAGSDPDQRGAARGS